MSAEPKKRSFEVHQEADRIDPRRLRRAAAIGAAGMFVSVVATLVLLRTSRHQSPDTTDAPAASGTVETSLIHTTERGLALERAQRAELDRFGWVDREAGIARIPIERAMDVLASDAGR